MSPSRLIFSGIVSLMAEFSGLSTPDLSEDLNNQALTNFLAKTNGSTQLFSASSNGRSFVRNGKFWLHGMKGLLATHVGYGPGATAVTPWHVLEANHHRNDVGAKLYFCDQTRNTIIRTVVAGTEIRPDIKSDIWLAELDEALPSSIAPMLLMPPDWASHASSVRLTVAAMNQAGCFGSATCVSFQPVSGWFRYGCAYGRSVMAPTMQFEPLHAGDSGHPIVTLVGTNLVLLGHITLESAGTTFLGPDYSRYLSDIQAAVAALGTNRIAQVQKISTIDLKGVP
jgi:hypothetical protein